MSDSEEQTIRPSPRTRWLLWGGFAVCWSAGLLLPIPIEAGTGLRSPEALFTYAKTLHVLAYATFTALSGWLPVPARYRWLLLVFLVGHAVLSEFLQWSIPSLGRTGSVRDVGIDLAAIGLGLAVSWKWWRLPSDAPGGRVE